VPAARGWAPMIEAHCRSPLKENKKIGCRTLRYIILYPRRREFARPPAATEAAQSRAAWIFPLEGAWVPSHRRGSPRCSESVNKDPYSISERGVNRNFGTGIGNLKADRFHGCDPLATPSRERPHRRGPDTRGTLPRARTCPRRTQMDGPSVAASRPAPGCHPYSALVAPRPCPSLFTDREPNQPDVL